METPSLPPLCRTVHANAPRLDASLEQVVALGGLAVRHKGHAIFPIEILGTHAVELPLVSHSRVTHHYNHVAEKPKGSLSRSASLSSLEQLLSASSSSRRCRPCRFIILIFGSVADHLPLFSFEEHPSQCPHGAVGVCGRAGIPQAVKGAQKGNKTKAHQDVDQSLAAFDELQRMEAAAEYGKWKHCYLGNWLTAICCTRKLVQPFSKFLDDPDTHIVAPVLWEGWEAYYHSMHYEGVRSADIQ